MQYLNKVMLLGHTTADPESKKTENGHTLTRFSVATNKFVKHENGETEDEAQFHRIIAWRKLGDLCASRLTKGSLVMVEGEIKYRSYQGDDGKTRYTTEITASRVIFLKIKKNEIEAESAEGDKEEEKEEK